MDNCNYKNPQRAPDWRWLRATGIANGSQPGPTRHRDGDEGNKWIKQAIRFQQELAACTTNLHRYALSERRPHLYWAWNLWRDESPMRWMLEAMILARVDDFVIGFKCGMDPEIVATYEAIFFNVRDRLQHQEVIVKAITRRAIEAGLFEREYELIWKLYAYFYGPDMLDAVSNRFVNPIWVASQDNVGVAIESDAVNTLKLKAMLAAKTIGVNAQTQMDLLYAFTKFVEVERTSETAGKAESQLLEHVMAMMTAMPFDVAGRDPRNNHEPVTRGLTAKFRNTAVELTFEESLRGGTGQELPDAEAQLLLCYPPRLGSEPAAGG